MNCSNSSVDVFKTLPSLFIACKFDYTAMYSMHSCDKHCQKYAKGVGISIGGSENEPEYATFGIVSSFLRHL